METGISKLWNKVRKKYLEKRGLIKCGFCKYNRGENSKRKEKPNKYKNIDRDSIKFTPTTNE